VDSVRNQPIYELFDKKVPHALRSFQQSHSGRWHYENHFYFKPNERFRCKLTNNGKLEDAVSAIDAALKEDLNKEQEVILIAFAMHLIEDVHQPLHTGTLVRKDCSIDLGGNRYCLQRFGGKCVLNLHRLWDQAFEAHRGKPLHTEVSQSHFNDDFFLIHETRLALFEGERLLPSVYSIEENRAPYGRYVESSKSIARVRLVKSVERVTRFLKEHYEEQR
jgi:hypothetical protein